MRKFLLFFSLFLLSYNVYALGKQSNREVSVQRARQTLDSLYVHYSIPGSYLLRENFPFTDHYSATYLANGEQDNAANPYSYLWPFSGSFSAVNALFEVTNNNVYKKMLDNKVLPGLEEYFDTSRHPYAYSSYVRTAAPSDRFYDDNIWLGIDFTDLYALTKQNKYLEKAQLIWKFIESGTDNNLGGGVYWCEQKKESKNNFSNAHAADLAVKLFKATRDSSYYRQGKALYEWTKKNLQDSSDNLYYDNVRLDGKIGKAKYAYNSGQMLQAASLLFELTKKDSYLLDARNLAKACYDYFFMPFTSSKGESFQIIKKGDIWFTAVMLRGFIEFYSIDKTKTYLDAFKSNLDFVWINSRDSQGLFNTDWTGEQKDQRKWLLTQAAMIEMYARIAIVK